MKRLKMDLESAFEALTNTKIQTKTTTAEGLSLDYGILLRKSLADELMNQLENSIQYYEGDLTKVKVFGKWHKIPRQQVAYGDEGLTYSFSGNTLPAKSWIPPLQAVRDLLARITGFQYNFVLVNRYKDGNDHIGEHRDGESDLDKNVPIASVSLGQNRDFVLRHRDSRNKGEFKRKIPSVKINLEHGSLLLMNPPTNDFWYHSLPARKKAIGARINLTFRKIISQ